MQNDKKYGDAPVVGSERTSKGRRWRMVICGCGQRYEMKKYEGICPACGMRYVWY